MQPCFWSAHAKKCRRRFRSAKRRLLTANRRHPVRLDCNRGPKRDDAISSPSLFNARILTLDVNEWIIESGYVLIRDGLIAGVGDGPCPEPMPADRRIDCRNRLITPGLITAHAHSQSSTMSGFGDKLSHPAFMWLTQAHTSRRTPDEIRLGVYLEAYGLITTGTTAVIDHFPGQRFTVDDMDAVLSAWNETGMRAALAMRYFDGDFAIFSPRRRYRKTSKSACGPSNFKSRRPRKSWPDLWNWSFDVGMANRGTVFPAPSNPDRCTDASLLLCAELAVRFDTGIHTHRLETHKQADLAAQRYNATTVRHLEDLGVLSDRWSCAHSTWLTDADIELMAERQVTAVLNPESNARLGTGAANAPALLRRGVPVALGTDGSSANDNLVMHEAMRAVATAHRSGEPDRGRWIGAREALQMATTGGAKAMRQKNVGAISKGFLADIVMYRLDKPWWIPINDIVNQLVFAETGASVETVLIDGEIVVDNGAVKTFDVDAMAREVHDMVKSIRKRNSDLFAVADAIAAVVS